MPINFEPMQPDATKIALAYGASEARQKDREFALQSYQAHQAAADRSSALSQEDEHFRAQLQQQAGLESMREQNQANLQATSQSHQAQMAQLESTLRTNQLGQAEQMRLNNLNRQLEYVRSNTGDGKKFSQTEGDAMEADLQTGGHGINVLQLRDQIAQTARRNLAQRQMQDFNAQQSAMANMDAGARLQHMRENPQFTLWHPVTGEPIGQVVPNGDGSSHIVPMPKPETPASTGPRPMTSAQTAGFRRSAEASVERDPAFMGRPAAERAAEVQRRFQSWTSQPGAENAASPRPIELPRETGLGSQEFRALPADQRDTIRTLNEDEAILTGANSRLTPDERLETTQDFARFRDLYFQFGSIDAIPPQERREAVAIARRIQDLKTQQLQRPARRSTPAAGAPATRRPAEDAAIAGFTSGV